jgi:chemotaxis protein CheC
MRYIEPYQMDILKEIINIGVGRAAGILNEMTKFRVILQVPFIKVLSSFSLKEEMEELDRDIIAAVRLGFKGPFSGCAALVFPPDSASKLVAVLTGEEPGTPDLDSVRVGTLSEVGNIVLNGVMGSIGNILKQHISYSIPTYIEDTIENLLTIDTNINPPPNIILLVRIRFTIQQLQIEGDIILLFEVGSFTALLSAIDAIRAD